MRRWIHIILSFSVWLIASAAWAEVSGAERKSGHLFKRFVYAGKVSADEVEGHYSPIEALMTEFYDVSLGLTTIFLLIVLGWSVALRRKVKEQTEQIRLQVKREAALAEQYRELFENANDVVYAHDLEGKFVSLNKAGEKILCCSREQALSLNIREFVAKEQSEVFDLWMKRALTSNGAPQFEVEIVARDGSSAILEVSTRLIKQEDQLVGMQGIARDITERKKAEEALRQSEERFSSAFRASPVSIAISTLGEGRYLDVNESFQRLFGFSRDEAVGQTAEQLNIWADPETRARIEQTLRERRAICGVESKFRAKSGAIRTALVFVELIDIGNVPCTLFITYDITDRLILENQLRQAMKMEAVGRLAAGVAHDFNNILTIIQGNSLVAMTRINLDPELAKPLGRISDAAQRAANLTRQLLMFSRKQVMQPKALDLNESINNFTKMLKHLLSEDIDLNFNFAANLPFIQADATMIEQIIMNLVVNARDAMPEGGKLNISTSAIPIDREYAAQHPEAREGDYVCLNVTDTGCGMDAVTQSRIFEPFFTTKEVGKGTGLGLATAYGIVKQHQGWIEVISAEGKGTTFKVFLPGDKTITASNKKPSSKAVHKAQETILVVEDEPDLGELLRSVLQDNGYQVFEASNGLEALQVWNEHHGDIDLLLTDMKMPKGMSGHDLAQNLKALKPDLKVIYTSGYAPEVAGFDLELHEGVNFLPKPYALPKLLQMVRERCRPVASSIAA